MNKLTVLLSLLLLVGFVSADTPCARYVAFLTPTDFTNSTIFQGQNITVKAYVYWLASECGFLSDGSVWLEMWNGTQFNTISSTTNLSTCSTNPQSIRFSGRTYTWSIDGKDLSYASIYHYRIRAQAWYLFGITNRYAISNETYINVNSSLYQHCSNLSQSYSACNNRQTCFQLNANSLTVDCNGYNLWGNFTSAGITATNRTGTTIRECNLQNYTVGLQLWNSSATVSQVNITNTTEGAIFLNSTSDSSFSKMTLNNSLGYIISMLGHRNYFNLITANNFSGWGIVINGDNNTIANSSISSPNVTTGFQQVIRMNYTSTNLTFVNVSANFSNATFATASIAQNFTVKWYARVNVTDNILYSKISTVMVKDNNSIQYYSGYSSLTDWFIINSTTRYGDLTNRSYSNYSVYVNSSSPTLINLTYWNFSTNTGTTYDYHQPTVNITFYTMPNCGHVIIGNNTFYHNIYGSGTCLTIGADNTTIDCSGYSLTFGTAGGDNVYGIYNPGYNNTIIKNCIITDGSITGSYHHGIYVDRQVTNLSITHTNISMISYIGIGLFSYGIKNSLLSDIRITTIGQYGYGVYLYDYTRNVTANQIIVTATGNPAYGFILGGGADNITLTNSTIYTEFSPALYLFNAITKSNIYSNVFSTTGNYALWFSDNVSMINITNSIFYSSSEAYTLVLQGGVLPVHDIIFANGSINYPGIVNTPQILAQSGAYNIFILNDSNIDNNVCCVIADDTISPTNNNITIQRYARFNITDGISPLNSTIMVIDNFSSTIFNSSNYALSPWVIVNSTIYSANSGTSVNFDYLYNITANRTGYIQNSSNNTFYDLNSVTTSLILYPVFDVGVPNLTWIGTTPVNNTYQNSTGAYFNLTTNITVQNCSLNVNGLEVLMDFANYTNAYHTIAGFGDGEYVFYANCTTSTSMNGTSETRNFSVDTVAPVITFVSPTSANNSIVHVNYTLINITSDEVLVNSSISWNGTIQNMTMTTSSNWFINETDLLNGWYLYWVYGFDVAGNIGASQVRNLTIRVLIPILINETISIINTPSYMTNDMIVEDGIIMPKQVHEWEK